MRQKKKYKIISEADASGLSILKATSNVGLSNKILSTLEDKSSREYAKGLIRRKK